MARAAWNAERAAGLLSNHVTAASHIVKEMERKVEDARDEDEVGRADVLFLIERSERLEEAVAALRAAARRVLREYVGARARAADEDEE